MAIVVTIQSYVSKRTPKNIRGMIYAVIGCMGAFGCILYLQLYSFFLTLWPKAAWLAFGTISLIDAVTLVFLLIFIALGKFG